MVYHLDDTIVAIASPPGGAARGIVRLSGDQVTEILHKCFVVGESQSLPTRTARRVTGEFLLDAKLPPLPSDLYFWPTQRSFTGQPVAELHTLGSPPLLQAMIARLCQTGARLAGPGEFTLRAFLAGRIDLTQAEAVLGVVDAVSRKQLDVAVQQLAGGLSAGLGDLRERLLNLCADIEAGLDFVDEDIQFVSSQQIGQELQAARQTVDQLLGQMSQRGEARAEARVVLKGRPNVGKSTLWNTLIQRESAIVSHEPGTTRDYLETTFDLGPIRCLLVDTAGIDSELTAGGIDHAAQQLARRSHDQSDVTLLCLDSSRSLDEWETDQLAQCGPNDIIVATKIDLQQVGGDMDQWPIDVARVHRVSSHTGFGVAALRQRLIEQLLDGQSAHVEVVTSTASRCHDSLRLASEALQRADALNSSKAGDELIAAELRDALYQLGLVVGAIYTDDILDRVFSRFCIGK